VPSCRECYKFDPVNQVCSVPEGSPIRKCVLAFLEQSIRNLEPAASVVEVGCGNKSHIRDEALARGCTWYGVDPKPPGDTIATHRGRVEDMPLPDACMDAIFVSQSMEHWHEFGTRHATGLLEIFRVLRPGGRLYIDVPIHLHGHRWFVRGETDKIIGMLDPHLWAEPLIEEWRRDFEPLPRYPRWRRYGFPDAVIPNPDTNSTWLLSIVVAKRADVPSGLLAGLRLREAILGTLARAVFLVRLGIDITRWKAIHLLSLILPEAIKRPLNRMLGRAKSDSQTSPE
jgi:SAM-dependent methyltransferase